MMLRFFATGKFQRQGLSGFLVLVAVSLLAVLPQAAQAAAPPNVVLIFSDDQGWGDVSCYGSEISTPNIDSLARDGAKLTQWYVASSICTPSRFGLLTGRYPSRSQDRLLGALMSLGDKDAARGIQKGETTFPQLLQQQGYRTALVGKWHLGHGNVGFLPMSHGFDSFYGHTAGCIDFFTMRYGVKPDWYRNEKLIDRTGYATDLITTLSRICGADPSKFELDGRDIRPQLFEDAADTDRELFWELSHSVALRDGPWKYVRTGDKEEYLFNLAKDRDEKKNLAEAEPEVFNRLKARHARLALEYQKSNSK